jgi:alcohol dehydrogenase class IV
MQSFNFNTTPGIRFGEDLSVKSAEEVCTKLGSKILFVTDPGLVKLGLIDNTIKALKVNSEVLIFDSVEADPSLKTLMLCVEEGKNFKASGVIGFGGGSSMDTAKLTALLLGSGENIHEA